MANSKPNFALYTRKTSLTFVPKNGEEIPEGYYDIAGTYFVKGTNTTVGGHNSVSKKSDVCNILAPADVVIDTDLSGHMFLDDKTNTLSMSIKEDEANPQRFYNVYYSENAFTEDDIATMTPESDGNADLEGNQLMVILDGENNINYPLTAGKFGYYMIQPISKLNRVEKTEASALCYVSDHPGKPLGVMMINNVNPLTKDVDENEVPDTVGTIDANTSFEWIGGVDSKVIEINATGNIGQEITLQVIPTIENASKFNTGTVTYQWKKTLEGVTVDIKEPSNSEGDIADINLETGLLKVRAIAPETGKYTYTCKIFNTISTDSAESDEYSFTIV